MKDKMMCDLETGICGEQGNPIESINLKQEQPIATLYYVTDPICSHCWALEPVLRKFEAQYGTYFKVKTIMGGLLKNWDGFADSKNGISKPSDVAVHWREVGEHSRMPIDGSLWHDNPIQSSYTPSRVFKVIQQENPDLATIFLRHAREAVFAFNKNIEEDTVLIELINQIGLKGHNIVEKAKLPNSQKLLDEDFSTAASLSVTGFPSIILVNDKNEGVKISGVQTLDNYVKALQQVLSNDKLEIQTVPSLQNFFQREKHLFSKEIEVMYDLDKHEVKPFIEVNLQPDNYVTKEILNELYIEKK